MRKARKRRDRAGPPIPPRAGELRHARRFIDPAESFLLKMPDGSFFSATGAELLATADMFTSLIDAQRSGDVKRIRRALIRISQPD